MGIKFKCPQCHKKLNVKSFLAGKRGVCPHCKAGLDIPNLPDDKQDDGTEISPATVAPTVPTQPSMPPVPSVQPTITPKPVANVAPAQPTTVPKPAPVAPATGMPAVATQGPTIPVGVAVQPTVDGAGTQSTGYPVNAPGGLTVPVGNVAPVVPVGPVSVGPVTPVGVPLGAVVPTLPAGAVPAVPVGVVAPIPHPSPAATMPDPFSEAPQAVWYVRPPSGCQYGPAKPDSMRRWIDEGRVTADSLVWREGWADWRPANATFPRFATAPVPAPHAGPMHGVPPGMPNAPFGGALVHTATPLQVMPAIAVSADTPAPAGGGRAGNLRKKSSVGPLVAIVFLVIALIVLIPILILALKGGF